MTHQDDCKDGARRIGGGHAHPAPQTLCAVARQAAKPRAQDPDPPAERGKGGIVRADRQGPGLKHPRIAIPLAQPRLPDRFDDQQTLRRLLGFRDQRGEGASHRPCKTRTQRDGAEQHGDSQPPRQEAKQAVPQMCQSCLGRHAVLAFSKTRDKAMEQNKNKYEQMSSENHGDQANDT